MTIKVDTYEGPHFIPCPHCNNSTPPHFFLVDENNWLVCPAPLATKKMATEAIVKYTMEQDWNQTVYKYLSDQLGQLNLPEDIEGFPPLENVLDEVREIKNSMLLILSPSIQFTQH